MSPMSTVRLGVNVDHVATLREQRHTPYPDLREAIRLVEDAGADGITMHLREDRRHIQLADVEMAREEVRGTLNLEMAATEEMLDIACRIRPDYCCLVPERREELTTEGGLDVKGGAGWIQEACARLTEAGIQVSLFVDASVEAVDAAVAAKAPLVELHTGAYANLTQPEACRVELGRLRDVAEYAQGKATVNAGHGLHRDNVGEVAAIEGMNELNIGHAIVCRAVMVGLAEAVHEIRQAMGVA